MTMRPGKHLIEDDGVTHSANCFPCKLDSITFAPSAMVSRSPSAVKAKTADPQLEKDRTAYRDLRRDGTQPKSVTGAHDLMTRANEKFEITTGRIISDDSLRHRSAVAYAEMPKPSTTPIVREDSV